VTLIPSSKVHHPITARKISLIFHLTHAPTLTPQLSYGSGVNDIEQRLQYVAQEAGRSTTLSQKLVVCTDIVPIWGDSKEKIPWKRRTQRPQVIDLYARIETFRYVSRKPTTRIQAGKILTFTGSNEELTRAGTDAQELHA
jgi:hypothetical protein